MTVVDDLLTMNEYSRPGKELKEVKAIVLHWTGNPGSSAQANRDYFDSLKSGIAGYASAHYVVGYEGEVLRCIPDIEVAYHCGTSRIDPVSGKVYTDYAREKFGKYCIDYQNNSPNNCTIGIEICPLDKKGHFGYETWKSSEELTVYLLQKFGLSIKDITYHSQIVGTGFKLCPLLFCNHPAEFQRFVQETSNLMLVAP